MSTPTLIALSGYAGCGKDAAAAGLVADGWRRVAFADVLRAFALALDPRVSTGGGYSPALSSVIHAYGWEAAKRRYPEVRVLLQRLGTDAGRTLLGQDVWVDAALADIAPGERVVITDCRFPNEAAAVRARGGLVVRVQRPTMHPVNDHISERALDDPAHWDAVLANTGTVADLHERLRGLLAGRDTSGRIGEPAVALTPHPQEEHRG